MTSDGLATNQQGPMAARDEKAGILRPRPQLGFHCACSRARVHVAICHVERDTNNRVQAISEPKSSSFMQGSFKIVWTWISVKVSKMVRQMMGVPLLSPGICHSLGHGTRMPSQFFRVMSAERKKS